MQLLLFRMNVLSILKEVSVLSKVKPFLCVANRKDLTCGLLIFPEMCK